MTATQQADAFKALSALLDDVYGAGGADRPRLVGPDTHSFKDAGSSTKVVIQFLQDFARDAMSVVTGITHHEYIEITSDNVLTPSFLDITVTLATQMVAAIRAVSPTLEVWAGEIGPHNGGTYGPGGITPNCAGNHVCGRFGSAIWYADSMAAKATAGYAAFNRQDVIGADYGLLNSSTLMPTPDYWLLRLWKATVGTRVLAAQSPSATLRTYAFCAAPSAAPAAVTLILINLDPKAPVCVAAPPFANGNMSVFALAPGADGVTDASAYLNGQLLSVGADGKVPPVSGQSVPPIQGITVPPQSVTFVTIPAAAGAVPACM
jgi:heparanase 1